MIVGGGVLDQIAIVGMSGRFPGAPDLDAFWRNLREGVESITFFGDEELQRQRIDRARLGNPNFVAAKSHLDDQELFDAGFFGYSPQEAELIDPQHRLFLECAWEALEHAGYVPATFPGQIGIFAGANQNTYLWFNLLSKPEFMDRLGPLRTVITNGADYLAPRAAYKLNLTGPSCTVQTACSTSLVAVHLACQSLLNFECDLALAGAVSLNVSPFLGYTYEAGGLLSRDGHTRAFDSGAAGTVFGEGVGLVVLKRLEDALADRDTIHAVVLGSAVNNDGASKAGFTALGTAGQAAVVHQAIENAGIPADTLSYVEAHGTATDLGDAIEVRALTTAFRHSTPNRGFCAIGSVKTNIGHLTAAAGIAGLLKVALSLEHEQLPPSINFERPNPNIDFAGSPFFVNARLTSWSRSDRPRRAGINAFGIGGTNAHVILEQAPASPRPAPSRQAQLIVLSARSERALEGVRTRLVEHLKRLPGQSLADVAYTLSLGRSAFRCRLAAIGTGREDVIDALDAPDGHRSWTAAPRSIGRPVVFLFPPDVSQLARPGGAAPHPLVSAEIDRLASRMRALTGVDLGDWLRAAAAGDAPAGPQLQRESIGLPALVVVELAWANVLMRWGVKPDAVLGSGAGEYAAACVAGILHEDHALALAAACGSLRDAAANSGELDALTAAFRARVTAARPVSPSLPIVSSVTGCTMTGDLVGDVEYWLRHARTESIHEAALGVLLASGDHLIVNIGSGQSLRTRLQADPSAALWTGADASQLIEDSQDLLATLGRLWVMGARVDWTAFWGSEPRGRVPLPTYPFERQRYWSDPFVRAASPGAGMPSIPVLATDEIADWFSIDVWRESTAAVAAGAAASGPSGTSVIFDGETNLGDPLVETLARQGHDVVVVSAGAAFAREGHGRFVLRRDALEDYVELFATLRAERRAPARVVHLWGIGPTPATIDSVLERGVGSVSHLAHVAAADGEHALARVLVVTSGAMQVLGEEAPEPARLAALGPLRVLTQSDPRLSMRAVDVELPRDERDRTALAARLARELAVDDDGDRVAWRQNRRWVLRREAVRIATPEDGPLVAGGTWCVMTGASADVGAALAEALLRRERPLLALLEQAPLPARGEWAQWVADYGEDDVTSRRIRTLTRLVALGATVVAPEAWEPASIRRALIAAGVASDAVGLAIHAAPLSASAPATERDRDVLTRALLEAQLFVEAVPAGLVVLCSSRDAERGVAVTGEVCALHVYLEALASREPATPGTRLMTVAWDRWQLPHDDRPGLEPSAAVEALARAVSNELRHVTVSARRDEGPLVDRENTGNVSRRASTDVSETVAAHARPSLDTPYVEPMSPIESEVARIWAELLGIDRVGLDDPFIELGGDSLLAMQVTARLRTARRVEMSIREVMEHATVRRLAAVIAARSLGAPDAASELVLALDDLSDEEAAAQLRMLQMDPTMRP
ncbi:MAG: beta-ketoacyl synthase N-terminal-like domain-containing protein [Acidobacteriota bacterium]